MVWFKHFVQIPELRTGGLQYEQAIYLLNEIIISGRKIIGFDIVEVAPGDDEWDAIVGARLLYKLCNLALKSNVEFV